MCTENLEIQKSEAPLVPCLLLPIPTNIPSFMQREKCTDAIWKYIMQLISFNWDTFRMDT